VESVSMGKATLNLHRLFAGLLLLVGAFAGVDYFLDLGLPGNRVSRGVLILCTMLMVVYGGFFSPRREDMRQHREANRRAKDE
jgi:NADH:ubiquinone oxidoreductase subunit 4 (subunit M)